MPLARRRRGLYRDRCSDPVVVDDMSECGCRYHAYGKCVDCDAPCCEPNAPGSVLLTAEQVEQVRGMKEQADRSAFAVDDELLRQFHMGRAAGLNSVLALLAAKEEKS